VYTLERGLDHTLTLVDRELYPENEFPAGQWDYMRYARYDNVCECTHSRLAEPMRGYCRNLTEETIRSGHWLAQEKPLEVNAALVKWMANTIPDVCRSRSKSEACTCQFSRGSGAATKMRPPRFSCP
jgi:hypothetical protein